jgi:hypothetical protein
VGQSGSLGFSEEWNNRDERDLYKIINLSW